MNNIISSAKKYSFHRANFDSSEMHMGEGKESLPPPSPGLARRGKVHVGGECAPPD